MTYNYRGLDTIQASADKAAKAKAEAQATLKERAALLRKIRNDRAQTERLQAEIRAIEAASRDAKLPPIIHGGPAGLKAAADEIERYEARKRARMTAKVKPSPRGGWIGICTECKETIAGHTSMVDLWADVHNDDNHRGES